MRTLYQEEPGRGSRPRRRYTNPGQWATCHEIASISALRKVNIDVWERSRRPDVYTIYSKYCCPGALTTVNIEYVDGNHFHGMTIVGTRRR